MRSTIIALSIAAMLSACGPSPTPINVQTGVPIGQTPIVQPQDPQQYAQPVQQAAPQYAPQQAAPQYAQPAPVIVQQPAQPVIVQNHDSGPGVGTAIAAGAAGLAIGTLLSNSSNNSGYRPDYRPNYTQPTVVNRTVNNTTIIRSAPAPVAPAPTQPATAIAQKPKVNIVSNVAPARPTQTSKPMQSAPARPSSKK